ncbi:MAG: ABC transporter permease [Firmicutes bacterium]|nr:ABC transporter permease [Bacillota bacterium]
MERIRQMVIKEILQIIRDKRMLPLLFIAPMIQLILFGYAATFDIKNVHMAVVDDDKSLASRKIRELFTGSAYFIIPEEVNSEKEAMRLMAGGVIKLYIRIPVDFSKDIKKRIPAQVQVIFDGSDSNSANVIRGYVEKILFDESFRITFKRIQDMGINPKIMGGIDTRLRVWFNPELKSVNFMVPGMIAMILLTMTSMFTAMTIVKERELGTLEHLMVTPMTSFELILGKILPWVIIGFVEALLVIAVGVFWFKVAIKGSILLLFFFSGFFLLSTFSLGLFISTVSKTQQQAMITNIFFMFPNVILSGFMFPVENMPPLMQYLSYIIPLRYYLVIVRGIFLKGVGPSALWDNVIPLIIFGVVMITLSVLRFRKKLE